LPSNFFGTFAYHRPGTDYTVFTDSAVTQFRRIPTATPEPLTYTLTRNVRHAGDKTWRDDLFTFSDSEVWEIVTETTLTPSGDIQIGPVTATKSGTSAAPHEFHAKLATARAADEQPQAPLTCHVDRQESSEGSKHWDNALYAFSDGEIWKITEWTQKAPAPRYGPTAASIWFGESRRKPHTPTSSPRFAYPHDQLTHPLQPRQPLRGTTAMKISGTTTKPSRSP
jgi:hypothetical protein